MALPLESPSSDRTTNPFLPSDIIFEILSRTPIKSICRFRCVSREWQTLIASPAFLATHKSRGGLLPLLAAIDNLDLKLMDMDGKMVKEMEIGIPWYYQMSNLNIFEGRIGLASDSNFDAHLIDMATGDVLLGAYTLHMAFPYERFGIRALIGAGHAAVSGKLKVVRLMQCFGADGGLLQVCQVLEFDPKAGGDSCCWSDSHSPPTEAGVHRLDSDAATVDGVVHFLTSEDNLLRFDLETEQWRKTVGCPPVDEGTTETRVAELNGALCMVAHRRPAAEPPCIDIWRLGEPEKSTWVKAYTIPTHRSLMPLMVTPDGGKILFSDLLLTRTPPPELLLYDLGDKTWNIRTISDEISTTPAVCRLHLEHFLV